MYLDFFYLGLVFIITHELDAMRCQEWRILPILSRLPEATAQTVFILLHLPLFYLLLLKSGDSTWQQGLDCFFIIHLLLHLILLTHPKNAFKSSLSWFLIVGTAVCGLLDLVL